MVPRLAGALALLFASTLVFAQAKTIKIEFAGEGQREVWIQEKGKEGTVPDRTPVSGKAVDIEAPSETTDKKVYVRDVKTGNVATRDLATVVKAGRWQVTDKDETHTYSLAFLVAHDEKPVVSAVLKLKVGEEERHTLLTPKDMGMAGFLVVPYGEVSLTVEYESGGEDKSLPAQTFEVKPGMAESGPITVSITDDVDTASQDEPTTAIPGEPEKDATDEEKKEKDAPRTNFFSTVINMLFGLLVIGGISYAIWRYVKANPDQAADALKKAGVQVPGDPSDPSVAAPKKAGPPQQILLGDAAPVPSDAIVAAAPVVKNPRLVKADGSLFIVQDGEQTVGRENASLTLSGESSVSRMHAKLLRTGDTVTLEDVGSTNGTFINGQRASGPTQLRPGDSVQFGAVQYRYEE